jgi:hypothetical protein
MRYKTIGVDMIRVFYNTFLLIVTIMFSYNIWAGSLIEDIKTKAANYYELGEDNNYIDSEIIYSTSFEEQRKISEKIPLDFNSKKLMKAIKECVFMKKGAYGDHLSQELHNLIATKFADSLLLLNKITVYRFSPQEKFFINSLYAPCVLAIEHKEKVLLLQGALMD